MASSGVAGPNAGLLWGWLDGESGWGLNGFNPNMALLDALFMPEVISAALAAPPGSPVAGDRYIVGAAPTGAWAGQAKAIAVYRGAAWAFYAPKKGWRVYDTASAKFLFYDGAAWSIEAGSAAVPEAPSDGKLYYRKDAAWTLGQQDVSMFIPGALTATNALLARYTFARPISLPVGLAGAQCNLVAPPTAATSLVLKKITLANVVTTIGTVDFAAGADIATYTFAAATAFAIGERLGIFSPSALDATAADFSLTFIGNRT